MKRLLILFVVFFCAFVLGAFVTPHASSDELDNINKQISDLTDALNKSKAATTPLESQLSGMQKQITSIKQSVAGVEADIVQKKQSIDSGYKNLAKQQDILNKAIQDFYIKSYYSSPLMTLLSSKNASTATQMLAYQKAATDQDKIIIANIVLSIQDLEEKKKSLESEQVRLTALKATLDEQSAKLDTVIKGAKQYQATLSSQIAQLSAQQQQLIAQKQGSLNIPKSAGSGASACVDDRSVDPGFSPALAFFTYGVPNRVGLNQYGAWGRAKAGQNVEQILSDYYPGITLKKDYDAGATINVNGYGTFNVEDYVKRIYEMPSSWTDNDSAALKAQAVAARSYGLAHRSGICTTDYCQVFKPDPKGGAWDTAVDATRGWVLVDGSGNPVSTQYSSTHGGYILNINKFDGAGATPTSFAELNERAYDKDSPWFYCDWGSRPSYNKTAWLKPAEVADIVNVILLARADSSTKDHFYQPDKPHPYGGQVWDEGKVQSELRSRNITPYTSVSGITVSVDFNSGKTTSVNVSGDAGSQSFDAAEFKDWFNLRAPANVQIVGPLYNVEKR